MAKEVSDKPVDLAKADSGSTGRPLQMLSYHEKTKNDNNWGKIVMNHYINTAIFDSVGSNTIKGIKSLRSLYNAYNNILPEELFNYVTDPLKAINKKYTNFPAKIRPYNILRPSIDLYIGEFNKRPFLYDVTNADGDDVLNSFELHKTKTFRDNLVQRYVNTMNELYARQGEEGAVPSEEIPDPKSVISELNVSYKDAKALRGYRALKVMELELRLKEHWRKMFKDWLIGGSVNSIKFPMHGNVFYNKLSALWTYSDKGTFSGYGEDGEMGVAKFRVSPSEIVDMFYDKLKEKDIQKVEDEAGNGFPTRLFQSFFPADTRTGGSFEHNKVDLYYVCWKSKKLIGLLTYPDPITNEPQMDIVDEAYKVDKERGESIEWMWVNEAWHGWRVNEDLFIGIEPIPAQRNEMNNFSACKLPINTKAFSDAEAPNVSICYLGIPYQVLYIVLMYRLELTIAKSRGKVVLLDRNVIPDEEEGGTESFFWHSEALGYALVDRNQEGVDKNFNQYTVLDLSLFGYIKELIEIIEYIKQQWDDLLGINRQRKGQNTSSDGLGVNEQAIFRSSVISDLVFSGFEEFLERELAGLLDLSKYAWVDGKKGYWRNDEGRMEMLSVEPEDHISSEYGVYIQNITQYLDKLNLLKGQVNAVAQRKDLKVSTIVDMVFTESITEMKALLKKAEAAEQVFIEKTAANEGERAKQLEQMRQEYEIFKHSLDKDLINAEWDRKDNNEIIKASLDKDPGAGIDPYLQSVVDQSTERLKAMADERKEDKKNQVEREWMAVERDKMKSQEKIAKENNKAKLANKVVGEK